MIASREEGTNSFPTGAIIRSIFGLNCRNYVEYVIIHQPLVVAWGGGEKAVFAPHPPSSESAVLPPSKHVDGKTKSGFFCA